MKKSVLLLAVTLGFGTVFDTFALELDKKTAAAQSLNEERNAAMKGLANRMDSYKKLLDEIKSLGDELSKPDLSKETKESMTSQRDKKIVDLKAMEREIKAFQAATQKQLEEHAKAARQKQLEEQASRNRGEAIFESARDRRRAGGRLASPGHRPELQGGSGVSPLIVQDQSRDGSATFEVGSGGSGGRFSETTFNVQRSTFNFQRGRPLSLRKGGMRRESLK